MYKFSDHSNDQIQAFYNLRYGIVGLLPSSSSISAMSFSSNRGSRSRALTDLAICSTLEAPVMAELTLGFLMTQAKANVARSVPSLSAKGFSFLTCARFCCHCS